MKPWHISTDRNTTMTSSRRNDADIDKRSTGCGSDVIRSLSQQITSRDRRPSWEIRYKNLPQVTATSPSFLSIIANVIKIECTLVGGEEFLGVDPRTQCQFGIHAQTVLRRIGVGNILGVNYTPYQPRWQLESQWNQGPRCGTLAHGQCFIDR